MKTIVTQIPDYNTFYKGKQTVEIGYPWLTFGAIIALEKILEDSKGTFHILEIGMGGSTIFFSKRCNELVSLEHDANWFTKIERKLDFIQGFCYPIMDLLNIINDFIDVSFDIVLADGGANYKERQRLMDAAIPKVKKGGWLIIDNYEHLKFDPIGWDVYTFDMFRYSGRGTKLCRKL